MKKKGLWIIIGIIVILAIMFISSYNGLVSSREAINGEWAQVESQLQRRNDLIPNLVETVRGYAAHEEGIFLEIAAARERMMRPMTPAEATAAEAEMSGALGRLLAISEAYPELRASENFRSLQDELAGTENRIQFARSQYNNSVQTFNTRIQQFPRVILANMFGFEAAEYFQAAEGADQVPNVQF